MKLVKNFDEEFKNMASGMNMRPTTRDEVRTHLESFGLIGDVLDGLAANPEDNSAVEARVREEVRELCRAFPIYQ